MSASSYATGLVVGLLVGSFVGIMLYDIIRRAAVRRDIEKRDIEW